MKRDVGRVLFAAENQVLFDAEETDLALDSNGVILETQYSCVSAGTELAKLTGLQPFDFPATLGNRAVSRVLEAGPKCKGLKAGDLVFSHTHHVSHTKGGRLVAKLPESLNRPESALLGMAMVALTGVQTAHPDLGDRAVVIGAGLVGQCAAQLLELSGVQVTLIDRVDGRLKVAE